MDVDASNSKIGWTEGDGDGEKLHSQRLVQIVSRSVTRNAFAYFVQLVLNSVVHGKEICRARDIVRDIVHSPEKKHSEMVTREPNAPVGLVYFEVQAEFQR